jgi:hypothetical protein
MKRLVVNIAAALMLVATTAAFAQAQFTAIDGTVEVRPSDGGSWQPAEVGMEVGTDTYVSTGFNASAQIEVSGSTVQVEQLTRMAFGEIVAASDNVQTSVQLNVGRVNANVRSVEGRRPTFRVRGPVSTAAVRGTEFVYDGYSLRVNEGDVAFFNLIGQEHSVRAGQTSRAWAHDGIESVEATMVEELNF